MDIKCNDFSMTINDKTGSIDSIRNISQNNISREFIKCSNKPNSLFKIRFRYGDGNFYDLSSLDAKQFHAVKSSSDENSTILTYREIENFKGQIDVIIRTDLENNLSYWRINIKNESDMWIEWIDFPQITVPDDLVATGGKSKILWPAMEGVLVNDLKFREGNWLKYSPVEYPNKGWEGYYPGPCSTQMMAYYSPEGGLYMAAHDEHYNVKAIEYYPSDDGIKLEFRMFPGAVSGNYIMDYDMVIGTFEGDWHDAADIYRNWREKNNVAGLIKLKENKRVPKWTEKSPITVIYPVRGQMHMGDMTPNDDYYPFTNGLEHINKISDKTGSPVMALPMQWEGTAPWAPPYVWPPLGGEENFKIFVEELHNEGNFAGVYCSGIGWTNESCLVPSYSKTKQFEEQNLKRVMCDSPEGDSPSSAICQEPIRIGYDMCPANQFVNDTAVDEIKKILKSECDYIQFFDQNIGGASYFCYSKNHGHPPAPGKWQVEAMYNIMSEINCAIKENGRDVAIGCEAAAAEPFISQLPFNDLRFEINYMYGEPVPLYSYIYHEYVNNFMGNQNMACSAINFEKSPLNVLQRIAYSFVAGDMLSVVLADGGQIHWDWCTPWDVNKPDQEWVTTLIRNLNAWRRGFSTKYLCYGRMEKPFHIYGVKDMPMTLYNGEELHFPSLLTSRWTSQNDEHAQIVTNYTPDHQTFQLHVDNPGIKRIKIHKDSSGKNFEERKVENQIIEINIYQLSAIVIEFIL